MELFCLSMINTIGIGIMNKVSDIYTIMSYDQCNYSNTKISVDWDDCLHFPINFDFTKKNMFWVDYSYLAVIKVLYQRHFTKTNIIVSLIIFELNWIKWLEGHSDCIEVALRTKQGNILHLRILAPGATGQAWIFEPVVTGSMKMFQIIVPMRVAIMEFIVIMWVCSITVTQGISMALAANFRKSGNRIKLTKAVSSCLYTM